MRGNHRKTRVALFCLVVLTSLSLACVDFDLRTGEYGESGTVTDSDKERLEREEARSPGGSSSQSTERPPDSAEGIVFAFSGDNPAYHTGLLSQSTFYLNYDQGTAWANESREFEEPAGDIQTRRGTDSVQFNGTYDHANKTITGTLTIRTDGRSSGGETVARNVTYLMTGTLDARLVGDEWTGTVVGDSTLTQSWEDGATSDEETKHTVNWTITSVSIEKF